MAGRVMLAVLALLCAGSACGGSGPTSPSTVGYAGEWNGTVAQGGSVAFTVSEDQRVTRITVNYALSGCSGSATFSGLAADIATPQRPPGNPGAGPFDNPGFGYSSGAPQGANHISVTGAFTSSRTAIGVTVFSDFQGCGSGVGTWSATRR